MNGGTWNGIHAICTFYDYIICNMVHEISLVVVPSCAVNCCPCPGHWTNYVDVAYKSDHLAVRDAAGLPFRRSEADCSAYVSGLSPTHAAAGASLTFSFTAGGLLADFVTQRITFVDPPLVPDYNRDGVIDAQDVAAYVAGAGFSLRRGLCPGTRWSRRKDCRRDP